jgi:hypothetical protein
MKRVTSRKSVAPDLPLALLIDPRHGVARMKPEEFHELMARTSGLVTLRHKDWGIHGETVGKWTRVRLREET